MSLFDEYFPMDTGPGSNTGMARWRRMGRLWQVSGVVRGEGEELGLMGRSLPDQQVVIGTGAVWVDGFYGETGARWVDTPLNDGLVVARFEPDAQRVVLSYRWADDPVQDPAGWWEIPLWRLYADGRAEDRRYFVPPIGIIDIPGFVPRGRAFIGAAPATETDVPHGGNIATFFTDWAPDFDPGRTYRVSASISGVQSVGASFNWIRVELVLVQYATGTEVRRLRLTDPRPTFTAGEARVVSGWTAFSIVGVGNTQCFVQVTCNPTTGVLRFPPNSVRMEVEDVGIF